MLISSAIMAGVMTVMAHNGVHADKQQVECLAKNIFFEARGESIAEKMRVAQVTKNRVNLKWRGGETYCQVVYQKKYVKTSKRWVAQFSWTLDKSLSLEDIVSRNKAEKEAWRQSVEVAGLIMSGLIEGGVNGATHYHTKAVNPDWSEKMKLAWSGPGEHIYYK